MSDAAHRDALLARQLAGERLRFLAFYGHTGEGVGPWCLSQWREAPFTVDGVRYPTAEHWMMAEKARIFDDAEALAAVLAARTPAEAKRLGRSVRGFDDTEWAARRFAVVVNGSVAKFGQDPALRAWLLATGDRILVEAAPRDAVWGIGRGRDAAEDVRAWRGLNLLGFALGEARARLARTPGPAPAGVPLPPWRAHPGIHPASAFWRTGPGAADLAAFADSLRGLDPEARRDLEHHHPATGPWSGHYDPVG